MGKTKTVGDVGELLGAALHGLADSIDAILEKDPKTAKARIIEARTATDEAAIALVEVTDDPVTKDKILELFPRLNDPIEPPAPVVKGPDFGPCMEITGPKTAKGFPTCGRPSIYDGRRCADHRSDR